MKPTLKQSVAKTVSNARKRRGISQEELAYRANLDRTYVSGVERGVRNITLDSLERIIKGLNLDISSFLKEVLHGLTTQNNVSLQYKVRCYSSFSILDAFGKKIKVHASLFEKSLKRAHEIIDKIDGFEVNISEILGMRNLSALIGELFVISFAKESGGLFLKNPHQDGYPDLLLMDEKGKKVIEQLKTQNRLKEKTPFSPFLNGGLEVKATCGDVPTPKECAKKRLEKPDVGDQRIAFLKSYNWKAHHRETNNLIGLLWDFIDRKPRIVAAFFCSSLEENDWGKIVKPRSKGGRTTSVSIMTRKGVKKMFENWVIIIDDQRYRKFLNKYNKADLLE
ncbi:helix-turn-helix transcriptional regulator [Desulfobacterales bacterium HSG2]|nr:helix-turn-helix transcriptional regulator [Desulfobacterales bacterium HSG2]